eukprot:TRINITY_DN11901_c0_g3_i3.p1 TRINITY_DN11901_c0_g3~~TRINITY_DN11901_c0_g3_i3.p1  ORF type:complete len:1077 (+),score=229.75 TRINITY_DN11901_c0_g3_i3:283-3513(+)
MIFTILLTLCIQVHATTTLRVGIVSSIAADINIYNNVEKWLASSLPANSTTHDVIYEVSQIATSDYRRVMEDQSFELLVHNPVATACSTLEYFYQPLAATVKYAVGECAPFSSGVIVAAAESNIRDIQDLRGKSVITGSPLSVSSYLAQWTVLKQKDISMSLDMPQIVFNEDERIRLDLILNGTYDVAFLSTDVYQEHINSPAYRRADFRIIHEKFHVDHDRKAYPLTTSTELFPRMSLVVNPRVGIEIRKQVLDDLFAIPDNVSKSHGFCYWQPSQGSSRVNEIIEEAGLLVKEEGGILRECYNPASLYYYITCPHGYALRNQTEMDGACESLGYTCLKDSIYCVCSPCRRVCADDMDMNLKGECRCKGGMTRVGNGCMKSSSFWMSLGLGAVGIIALAVLVMHLVKKGTTDNLWLIKPENLRLDANPEVLGQGSFGVVLLAEYRGSQVAVKRLTPDARNNGSTKKSSSKRPLSRSRMALSGSNQHSKRISRRSKSLDQLQSAFHTANAAVAMSDHGSKRSASATTIGWLKRFFRSETAVMRANFIKEMRMLNGLRHPCIAQIVGAILKPEPLMIMEYASLGSLHGLLHNETMTFESATLLNYMRDIVSGMRFLHSGKPPVIHADLKSHNVLVDNKHRAKVSDFGLATTKAQVGAGTNFWMSPELLMGEPGSLASDVYAFAIVLSEMVTRKDPYEDCAHLETDVILEDVVRRTRRPKLHPKCPSEMKRLIEECWAYEAEYRPTFLELDRRMAGMSNNLLEEIIEQRQPRRRSRFKGTTSDDLLSQVFPEHIAEALKAGRKIEAEHHPMVTVFFSDIVGFTDISSSQPAEKVMDMLDRLYTKLDNLVDKHNLFKVETIGDAFMCVSNLHEPQPDDHVKRIALFSRDAIQAANATFIDEEDESLGYINIRVGFHSGPCVTNVVGHKNPRYCLFGDTVNMASRMESNSEKNRIHMSEASANLLNQQAKGTMAIISRGKMEIKGKGRINTFFLGTEEESLPTGKPTISFEATPKMETHTHRNRRASHQQAGAVAIDVGSETATDAEIPRSPGRSRRASNMQNHHAISMSLDPLPETSHE